MDSRRQRGWRRKFDKVMKEIRQKFPDLIKDYEIYGVLNEYKYVEIGRLIYG